MSRHRYQEFIADPEFPVIKFTGASGVLSLPTTKRKLGKHSNRTRKENMFLHTHFPFSSLISEHRLDVGFPSV